MTSRCALTFASVPRRTRRRERWRGPSRSCPGCPHVKPASTSLVGATRCPPRSISSPIWPNAALTADAGNGKKAGRCTARPSALTNSWFVMTPGATTLTGPASGCSRAKRYAATVSSNDTQLHHWRPLPTRPPAPSLNGGSSRASAPPPFARTIPWRRCTVRRPAARAGSAAAPPRLDDLGEESRARHRVLVDDLVAAVAVEPGRRRTDEDGTARETGRGLGDQARAVDA